MGVEGRGEEWLPLPEGEADWCAEARLRQAEMALDSAWKRVSWLYYQYLLVTALYMLEPWERTLFNVAEEILNFDNASLTAISFKHSMLVSILGMALYTGYVFMPQHIMAILHYFEIVQ